MNRISSITAKQMFDPFPDASYLETEGFQGRRQQYDNGDFGFIGIQAEAEIVVAKQAAGELIRRITGVEASLAARAGASAAGTAVGGGSDLF